MGHSRAEVVRAAMKEFVKHGLHRVTEKSIGKALDPPVGDSAVSEHFRGTVRGRNTGVKAAIIAAGLAESWSVVKRLFEDGHRRIDECERDNPLAVLQAVLRTFIATFRDPPDGDAQHRRDAILFLAMYYRDPSVDYDKRELVQFCERLDQLFVAGQCTGVFVKDVEPAVFREALLGAVVELLYHRAVMVSGTSRSTRSAAGKPTVYSLRDVEDAVGRLVGAFLQRARPAWSPPRRQPADARRKQSGR